MLVSDMPLSSSSESGSGALRMLVQGFPVSRTLEAAAGVVARLQHNTRCAILLVRDDRLEIAAEHDLTALDRRLLDQLSALPGAGALANFGLEHCAEVRPLVTHAAELIGALVVFNFNRSRDEEKLTGRLDEVCAIATLAIEQKHLTEELSYRAHHDPLTHLWNRVWMEEEIARTLDASFETGRSTGLMLIGLDSFRLINEVLGSQAGNELLRQVAMRLLNAMEPGFLLARGGGDEFIVLMPNLTSQDRVNTFCSQLLTWFDKPFEIGDHELLMRASIGTTVTAPGECEAGELQNRTDTALRYAKKCARGRAVAFTASMITTPPERLVMEKHLRFALPKREFELYYQPQIHLPTGNLIGVEALLRWKHASLGFISPASFIPIAEEIGIIEEIGEWVLGEAIQQLEYWHRSGLGGLRVAVNVSALQFSRSDFAATVAKRLRTALIKPEDLELEITESAVMTDFEHGLRQFKLLRSLGVLTALDDFGTGHSSLAYLQQLPIQRLKIDRMFVKNIVGREERPPLLSSIIQMGHALGCSVIAEGVETAEQAMALSAMQCEEVQGFLFARPLPAKDLLEWARARSVQ
ncbi:MAG TPA: EAL domain-containing protein [Candidatus Dormibacteraeota bacterium]|nr:EAL domain-containing protein [Candidatus Dormibacteraeota bacterium]